MNLVISVYYDDFARYFFKMENTFLDRGFKIFYVCNELSGFLYLKSHSSQTTVFISRLLCKDLSKSSRSSESEVELPFYKRTYTETEYGAIQLEFQIVKAYLKGKLPNHFVAILSGDARLVESYLSNRAAKVLFFEQGPFNTTTLSSSGVNANMLNNNTFLPPRKLALFNKKDYFIRGAKIKRGYFRVADYFYYGLSKLLGTTFMYEQFGRISLFDKVHQQVKKFIKSSKSNKTSVCNGKKIILIALQVSSDVNSVMHSSENVTPLKIIESMSFLQADFRIIVRTHPLEKVGINAEIYEICNHLQFDISQNTLLEDLTDADIVFTVNSTVGIESLVRKIPVVAFGKSYWMNLPGVLFLGEGINESVCDAKDLEDLISSGVDSAEIEDFVVENFSPGHFQHRNENRATFAHIADYFEEKI